ncbi:MAG: SusC/RagA family TonB-linked outer membrane protein [Bacteroidales bacterium]|nr:SusC/RagA family TonB-linked outer membrane protein [Bacteroidales bacterium]
MAIAVIALSSITAMGQTDVAKTISHIEEKAISGLVLDETGEPLPGATVIVEGTKIGVTTDLDGNFTLLTDIKSPTLEISYIGFSTVKVTCEPPYKFMRVIMKEVPNIMNDVVVTGYQTMKRENATGAYQIITASDLDKRHTGDIVSNLEGQVPGLVKQASNTNKFGDDALVIRGVGTFEAETKPLIVVDGLPIEGGLDTVNPYDVASITVLKDAAAASIYGARASNGIIVITTKRANKDKLTIDFNADLTISEKAKYDNLGYATAAQIVEMEQANFNALLNDPDSEGLYNTLYNYYYQGRMSLISPITRLLMANHLGELSDADLNSQLNVYSSNDFFKEYRDNYQRNDVTQEYNLAMRVQGRQLSSSLMVNYSYDNDGVVNEYANSLTFKYAGDLKVSPWLNLSFGVNVISNRQKYHADYTLSSMTAFYPYYSMWNADGTTSSLEVNIWPGEERLSDETYGLKDPTFNFIDEMNRNFTKYRYTNVRSYVNAMFKLLPGWTANAQFQYEDIYTRTATYYEKDSYFIRDIYDLYTYTSSGSVVHAVPEGGICQTKTVEGAYYTFRAQTNYNRTFFDKHEIDALAGFEYRQTHRQGENNTLYGYDQKTLTNSNILTDWYTIYNASKVSVLGSDYTVTGAPIAFGTSDTLHRYYSYYFTGNYIFDKRYAATSSYRVDKCDLFGTDPKFRGRPLWSVGASWNAHNEEFMRHLTWISALKFRFSYGLTGNIDSSVSSYLTAKLSTNLLNGNKEGTLTTPPNDQLRWEKTQTWNFGLDFALFNSRLNGSVDYYRKDGSDILSLTDLDVTTGWSSLTINNGKMRNTGVEIQLIGRILNPTDCNSLGINAIFNVAFNHNKITQVSHKPSTGYNYLNSNNLHEGYPIGSLFSFRSGGYKELDGYTYLTWFDADGEEHYTSVTSSDFTIDDCVYSGTTTPKVSGAFTPEITWRGFSLSGMFCFYGGHYMRTGYERWGQTSSTQNGYTNFSGAVLASGLDYWNGATDVLPSGYMSNYNHTSTNYGMYMDTNVVHADYIKLRNIVLSYNFDPKLCRKLGLNDLRLRVQMNNVCTWARNSLGLDPEAISPTSGMALTKAPRSYTFSLFFNI